MNESREQRSMLRQLALVYAPITILFALVILLVLWFGGEQQTKAKMEEVSKEVNSDESTTPAFTIIAFGDSITAGYGLDIKESYPSQLAQLLEKRGIKVNMVNAGVSGETTAGGLRRASFVAEQKPDLVILALGGNDMLRGIDPKATRENLEGILKVFRQKNIPVILAGMQAPINLGLSYRKQFNAIYPELAEAYDLPLVSFLLEDVALVPSLNQDDGIHPNKEGARIIAEKNVLPVVLDVLK